jgi:putative transposase
MEFRKQSNCIYLCDYHIILSTKYRRKIINEGVFEYIKIKLLEIGRYYPEIYMKEINHDRDHIHLLVSIPPKRSVGWTVKIIKSNTAREMKKKFGFLRKVYWGTESIWSKGYFVSTVGINESIIRKYISNQGIEDCAQAKLVLA